MSGMGDIPQFLKEVKSETSRVQWPPSRQTTAATGVVLVFVLITSLFLAGADALISLVMGLI